MQPEISRVMRIAARRVLILIVSCGWACAWSGNSSDHSGAARFPHGEALDHVEKCGNEENAEGTGREHSADHGGTHDLPRDGTRTGSGPERNATEDEGEGGHEDGSQT